MFNHEKMKEEHKFSKMKKDNLHAYIRNHYDVKKYWNPGMPVSEYDLEMLQEVKDIYKKQGYVPTKQEVSGASKLKSRFRTWNNVLIAAGLPSLNHPDEKKKRLDAINRAKKND